MLYFNLSRGWRTFLSLASIKWSLKQLLPLTYRSQYVTRENETRFAVWNMWLGHVYNIDDVLTK